MSILLSLLLLSASPQSSTPAPIPPEIENEQIIGINKQPWHATLMPYGDLREALAANRRKSSFARSLNGTWKFQYVPRPEQRPVDFYKPDYDVSRWDNISVPSNWQVLGYGTPYYRNAGYTFQRDWPHVMSEPPRNFTAYEERNPVGSYRRTFDVPSSWGSRRVFLSFDGVDSAFYLWVNGQKVGYSTNSRNVAEFDVTPYLRRGGTNTVALEVYRYSTGSFFEDQDMWRLSGIFRNVTLWSAPQTHLRDYSVTTDLDSDYRNGTLGITARVHNYGQSARNRTLTATLYDRAGKPVPGGAASVAVPQVEVGGERTISLAMPVANPAKWTAETPNLYTVVLALKDGVNPDELISSRVGFRKVEIKGRVFTINGVPVKLKGANRHEHWPDTGHYVSDERMIRDIEVLKQANCNHVRTCHYSDDPRWYELCDEYGLYLVAEANAECHGYYNVLDREPRFEKMVVDRSVANVENFKNHASVVIWSLGNECGGGSNFRAALEAVKRLDNTRPTHYEPFGIGEGNPADIDSRMYTDPAGTERAATDPKLTKPYYLCEYAHAMNNSMGSIGDYNDIFDKYPSLMGGAIWEWEDQGLWNRRDPKRQYLAYGGGFGEFPNDGFFIHKGVVFSDRSPKPHFPEVKRAYQWVGFAPADLAQGRIKVKNKFAFTNLDKYALSWSLSADGTRIAGGALPTLHLKPGSETVIDLPMPRIKPGPGTEYFVNLAMSLKSDEPWAKAGYEIANGQFALPIAMPAASTTVKSTVTLGETPSQVTVDGNGFSVAFDKSTGTLSSLRSGTTNVLLPNGGPRLHLWRAEHRNDDGYAARDWNQAGLRDLDRKVLGVTAKRLSPEAVQVVASVQYIGKSGFSANHVASYTVFGDGHVTVDNSVSPTGRKIYLGRIGVRMLLDRRLDSLTYLGRGPMENYSDRKRGSDIGLYGSTVKAQLTPYSKPMDCGNHEDMRWVSLQGAGQPTLLAQAEPGAPMQFSALPYTDEEMDAAAYSVDLPVSRATILCLSAKTLGVGSNSCGPRPLPQYLVQSESTSFSYSLRLLPSGSGSVSRQYAPERTAHPALVAIDAGRMVALTGSDLGLEYSLNGTVWNEYTAPFQAEQGTTLQIRSSRDGSSVTSAFLVPATPVSQFEKVAASSFQPGEGEPQNAIDGDPATYWHTRWEPSKAEPPHSLDLTLREARDVSTIRITPRQDMSNGRVKEYAVYLSLDGKTWGTPAAEGRFPDSGAVQTVRLKSPQRAKFLRIVVKSDHSGGNFAAIAEVEIGR